MTQVWGATSTTDEVLSGIDLHGKRVLVTGVSAGIGVETARSLAAHGAHVTGAARDLENMIEHMNRQLAAEGKAPYEWKTIPQGAATSVWAGFVAPADEVGGRYCENCHVGTIVAEDVVISAISEGVRAYALDPHNAEALWKKSEELVGESF